MYCFDPSFFFTFVFRFSFISLFIISIKHYRFAGQKRFGVEVNGTNDIDLKIMFFCTCLPWVRETRLLTTVCLKIKQCSEQTLKKTKVKHENRLLQISGGGKKFGVRIYRRHNVTDCYLGLKTVFMFTFVGQSFTLVIKCSVVCRCIKKFRKIENFAMSKGK